MSEPAPDDPIARFAAVLAEAKAIPRDVLPEPTAFALGTVDADGRPSVRIVLLKGVDERGFVFYTNYESRKGRELLASWRAAMCFHWQQLETQVRVEGRVDTVSEEEADAYFASRARGSQIGAWASLQGQPIPNTNALTARVAEAERRFANREVPRPPHWSGFRVVADRIEFWKGMPNRLHVRHLYTRERQAATLAATGTLNAGWRRDVLYP
ncbi:MAG TPA: pyridoxamine 5'-phosphate oxidase [Gemmatimonadaceae bacterium]